MGVDTCQGQGLHDDGDIAPLAAAERCTIAAMSQSSSDATGPVVCPIQRVEPGWIDYNGHMNMAFYHVMFDRALDHVYHLLGIDEAYLASGASCFTAEVHVCYLAELRSGEPARSEFQLLDWDAKRLHVFAHMYRADDGVLVATSEQLAIHVDLRSRRASEFPDDRIARIRTMFERHRSLPRPESAGRVIGIRKRR